MFGGRSGGGLGLAARPPAAAQDVLGEDDRLQLRPRNRVRSYRWNEYLSHRLAAPTPGGPGRLIPPLSYHLPSPEDVLSTASACGL